MVLFCVLIAISIPATAFGDLIPATIVASGQSGTTLTATVTATPQWTTTYGWTIDKSVTPNTWNLFKGDSGTSRYTIAVTKDAGTTVSTISGVVNVTNGGGVDTQGLAITANLVIPPKTVVTSVSVDVSGHPVLVPGESYNYPYTITVNGLAGDSYKVTADVTILNHSGSLGTPFGPSPSIGITWPSSPTVVNGAINVDDSNGGAWAFPDSGSAS